MATESKLTDSPALPKATLADFLESHPPGQIVQITDLTTKKNVVSPYLVYDFNLCLPVLQLHCANERCNGLRMFRCTLTEGPRLSEMVHETHFITYRCSNCQR